MRSWSERPQEEAYLLNPAFCALLLWRAVSGFSGAASAGMPFVLAYMVLPVVLHKATRDALPRDTRTSLAAWLENNGALRVRFAERAQSLVPFVREGLLFGTLHGALAIDEHGRLLAARRVQGITAYTQRATEEVRDCVRRAEFIGRWFANAGSETTLMALWGTRP